jgi:hypothetical protein
LVVYGESIQHGKSSFNYIAIRIILVKSLTITIILAVIFAGLGHIYLGHKKRGVIILVARVAIWVAVIWLVPFPIDWVVGPIIGGGFWIWQLIDIVRLYNKSKSPNMHGQTQVELRKD